MRNAGVDAMEGVMNGQMGECQWNGGGIGNTHTETQSFGGKQEGREHFFNKTKKNKTKKNIDSEHLLDDKMDSLPSTRT